MGDTSPLAVEAVLYTFGIPAPMTTSNLSGATRSGWSVCLAGWEVVCNCPPECTSQQCFRQQDAITGLAFREGEATLYSASFDRSVKIWSLSEMAYVDTLYGHQVCEVILPQSILQCRRQTFELRLLSVRSPRYLQSMPGGRNAALVPEMIKPAGSGR